MGLAVGVIFLEQLPVAFLRKNQPFWQILMLILAFLVVTLVTVLIAKRLGFLNHASQLLTRGAWKSIFMGFLVMIPVRMLGGITLVLEHGTKANTLNQSVIENLGMSPALLFVMTVVAAPIVEEFVFRGLIVKQAFHFSKLGVFGQQFAFWGTSYADRFGKLDSLRWYGISVSDDLSQNTKARVFYCCSCSE